MSSNKHIHVILLIDDDEDEHEIFSHALKDYNKNIHCITAASCVEANNLMLYKRPCLIFLDMNMPKVNGLSCLRTIKLNEQLKHIPVCMYSTSTDPTHTSNALENGAAKWFRKPITLEDYESMFDEWLNIVINTD